MQTRNGKKKEMGRLRALLSDAARVCKKGITLPSFEKKNADFQFSARPFTRLAKATPFWALGCSWFAAPK
jgi:hypothetical protein